MTNNRVVFCAKYKKDAIDVLTIMKDQLDNCFDDIGREFGERMRTALEAHSDDEKDVELEKKWLYVIIDAINLLDEDKAAKYHDLQEYVRKLRDKK